MLLFWKVDVDSDGDFDILVDVDGEYEYEEEVKYKNPPLRSHENTRNPTLKSLNKKVKQLRDEGEIQNECDGPCYKVMLKVQSAKKLCSRYKLLQSDAQGASSCGLGSGGWLKQEYSNICFCPNFF